MVLLAAAVAVAWPAPVGAQDQPVEPTIVRVAGISPWTAPGRPFTLTLQITNTTELTLRDVSVQVTFFTPVSTRSSLRLALDEGIAGTSIGAIDTAVDESIEPGEQGTVTVRRPMTDFASFRGVYPASITVSHAGGVIDLATAIPFFTPSDAPPINVALILPVSRPTVVGFDGGFSEETLERLRLDELAQQLAVLGTRPENGATLALDPSMVATLQQIGGPIEAPSPSPEGGAVPTPSPIAVDAAAMLEQLRAAASAAGEVATVPFTPADLRTLIPAGLRADLLRHITLGRTTIGSIVGRNPSLGFLVPPSLALDAASIDALRSLGIRGAILDPLLLAAPPAGPADLRPDLFGASFPVPVAAAADPFPVLLPDESLRARFTGSEQGVLLAQAVIAETMGSWQELPLSASRRIVVIAPWELPSPPALESLLDGLHRAPWVRLVTGSEAIAELQAEGGEIQALGAPEADRPFLAAARIARISLRTLSEITTEELSLIDELDRLILRSESNEWLADPARGTALAQTVVRQVQSLLDAIEVAPRRITLTSRTGDAPVTVLNGNPFPVRVRVRLAGSKVSFPSGASRLVELAQGDNTFSVPVEARAGGSFPLDVLVESPSGRRLTSGRLVLRSTAVSTVSLAIVGGSAGFLLLAWFRRTIRGRGSRGARGSRRPASPHSIPSRR